VAIGGASTDWYVDPAQPKRPTGTSNPGSFDDPDKSNVVFVFAQEYGNLFIERLKLATTVSHEAGHGFGLLHNPTYDANGTYVNEYNVGTAAWTPIMGDNNSTDRTTWNVGRAEDGLQDDMAFLSWKLGNRADDHGEAWSTGTLLAMPLNVNAAMTSQGIIGSTSDADAFLFNTTGGKIDVSVNGLKWSGNLAPVVEVYSNYGLIASAAATRGDVNNGNLMSAKLSVNLAAGPYMVMVKSAGDPGNAGQYALTVSPQKLAVASTVGPISPSGDWTSSEKSLVDAYYSHLGAGPRGPKLSPEAQPVVADATNRLALKRVANASYYAADVDLYRFDAAFELMGAV
jgi:hypothetical protein